MEELKQMRYLERETCILCGEDLQKLESRIERKCDFCGSVKPIAVECSNTHYICVDCMALSPTDYAYNVCLQYKGIDPIALAVDIMNSPVIRMHGAEHHFIVPAVLTTCMHNYLKSTESLKHKLDTIKRRADEETPHACSYDLGTCGAAIGTGVFMSAYLNRELRDEDEWSLSNTIVSQSLKRVADSGGPRCCKRDTYLALETAIEFIRDNFAISLPISTAKCTFSLRNRTCKHEDCQFYNLSNSLV